uniref:Ovule protein n=1 Tax=Heterorhabditis bacteriophora TaxID=37862 RepID=A0A1I7WCA2_HETBA
MCYSANRLDNAFYSRSSERERGYKTFRPWQDSNLQSSDPKSDALSIRPQGHNFTSSLDVFDSSVHRNADVL